MIYSNIVKKDLVRQNQLGALKIISDCLLNSFGPMGSNSALRRANEVTKYTKDGHTILQNIRFNRPIEFTTKDDLEDITRHIVKTVGDGTTSAIILAAIIFEKMAVLESNGTIPPIVLVENFKKEVKKIIDDIITHKNVTTPEDIYRIALISTNGNEEVATNLKNIYEEHGMEVFIDVTISNTPDSLLKVYDGLTLSAGYSDSAFINDAKTKRSSIRNPKIYVFEDPIDTQEMRSFVDSIIYNNIQIPVQAGQSPIPTVVLAPKIGRDTYGYMDKMIEMMAKAKPAEKPPLSIVTNINNMDYLHDIALLSGATFIKKYLDPAVQAADIASGLAPSPETVNNFAGTCDLVESDYNTTKFVNPAKMFEKKLVENEDGTTSITMVKSDIYAGMITGLEDQLQSAIDNKEDINVTGNIKRRINSLKANMVEYLVGGISMSDRDSLRDLVEDAVLSCRSAAADGYGFGANFEGLRSANYLANKEPDNQILKILNEAYGELAIKLYSTYTLDEKTAAPIVGDSITKQSPFNIRTEAFDGNVIASIKADIVVLESIAKIATIMFTCNQYLTESPQHNVYVDDVASTEVKAELTTTTK